MEKKEKYVDFGRIKEELDKLESKLNKGAEQLQHDFDGKRAKMSELVEEMEKELEKASDTGEKKVKQAQEEIDNLKDLLKRDFNFDYSSFEGSPKKLSDSLKDVEDRFKEWLDEAGKEAVGARERFQEEFQKRIHRLEIDMLIQQVYFEYNKRKSSETFEQWKGDVQTKIQELRNNLDDRMKDTEAKVDAFNLELKEAFSHIRKAFLGLFS